MSRTRKRPRHADVITLYAELDQWVNSTYFDTHQAFDDLYHRYSREVSALVYARLQNADQAQDIMQESFLRFWQQWDEQGEAILYPRAWLLKVARNLAEDHAKSAFCRHGTQEAEIMDAIPSAEPEPPEEAERREDRDRLLAALNELPGDYRAV